MIAVLREPLRPFAILEWRQGAGSMIGKTPPAAAERDCDELSFTL